MAIHDAGMFTVKKTNRLKILQDVIDRNLRPGQAAEMLSITPRHCSRLLKRYRQLSLDNNDGGRKAAPSVNQSYNQRPALADAMSIPIVNSGT